MSIDVSILSRHVQAANAHLPATMLWPKGTTEGVVNVADQTIIVSFGGLTDSEENTLAGVFHDTDSTILIAHADCVGGKLPEIHTIVTITDASGHAQQMRIKQYAPIHADGVSAVAILERLAG